MAITFSKEKKKQKSLLFIFIGLVGLAALFFLWKSISKPKSQTETSFPNFSTQRIEIKWEILKNVEIGNLQLLEEITPSEEKAGRSNPFVSY
jgi:hypothetical protein